MFCYQTDELITGGNLSVGWGSYIRHFTGYNCSINHDHNCTQHLPNETATLVTRHMTP